jgi:predicted MFS family arabinose efflux permease
MTEAATTATPPSGETSRGSAARLFVPAIVFVALVVAVIGSLGAPMITAVAEYYDVSLAAAQWTLTITLLSGAVATPVVGRIGSGPRRRAVGLGTLTVVVAGSALTVLPLPFAALLVGRAAQGVGLGLTALMMATARDHLPRERSAGTIALVSVASTAGIGVGYPLAGLLTDVDGIRAAYTLGLAVTVAALLVAAFALPAAPDRPAARVDVPGALLLTAALVAVLIVISETDLWRRHAALAATVLACGLALLLVWGVLEAHVDHPLVDVRLLRHPTVAAANLAMLTGGVGMYLLLSLITRYLQTPAAAGYGFGLDTLQAGLALVPFSLLGFAAGKVMPRLGRLAARALLAASTAVVLVAFVFFAVARANLAEPVVTLAVLGFGVGAFSAAMPGVILAATPKAETASAMSVNQVVRSVGFSIGSAVAGLILAAYTTGRFPQQTGYTAAAWTGAATTAATLFVVAALRPLPPTAGRPGSS